MPPAVEAQRPNHWTAREFPALFFFFMFSNTLSYLEILQRTSILIIKPKFQLHTCIKAPRSPEKELILSLPLNSDSTQLSFAFPLANFWAVHGELFQSVYFLCCIFSLLAYWYYFKLFYPCQSRVENFTSCKYRNWWILTKWSHMCNHPSQTKNERCQHPRGPSQTPQVTAPTFLLRGYH